MVEDAVLMRPVIEDAACDIASNSNEIGEDVREAVSLSDTVGEDGLKGVSSSSMVSYSMLNRTLFSRGGGFERRAGLAPEGHLSLLTLRSVFFPSKLSYG
jgi:hypothetical protein